MVKIISIDKADKLQKYPQHNCIGCRRPIDLTATITFMCTKCKNYFCEECAYYFNDLPEKTSNLCPGSKAVAIGNHTVVLAKITRTIKESNPMGVSITELERKTKSRIIENPTMKILDQNDTPNKSSVKIIADESSPETKDTDVDVSRPIKKTNKRQPIIIDENTNAEKK